MNANKFDFKDLESQRDMYDLSKTQKTLDITSYQLQEYIALNDKKLFLSMISANEEVFEDRESQISKINIDEDNSNEEETFLDNKQALISYEPKVETKMNFSSFTPIQYQSSKQYSLEKRLDYSFMTDSYYQRAGSFSSEINGISYYRK